MTPGISVRGRKDLEYGLASRKIGLVGHED
jgi:hypothetical protein